MFKKTVLLSLLVVFLLACAMLSPKETPKPEVTLTLPPAPFSEGAQSSLHVRVTNPGETDLSDLTLVLGYAREDDVNLVMIQQIPLTLTAGQVFEQDIPWRVDFHPDPDAKYVAKLMLLSSEKTSLAEMSTALTFAQPELSITITPTELTSDTQATISIKITNPTSAAWNGYSLGIGYSAENDASMILITNIPISLAGGESLSQEIPWQVDYIPASGSYKVRAVLLSPENVQRAIAETPVTLRAP